MTGGADKRNRLEGEPFAHRVTKDGGVRLRARGAGALRLARSHQGPLRLAELAAAAGYLDQQHLAHEVRTIMGTTPTRILRFR